MLCLAHLLVRVRYLRLWCCAKENHHLSLECHQVLSNLDPTVFFSRLAKSPCSFLQKSPAAWNAELFVYELTY